MMNVRIDPCNQSGETVMGRRTVMLVDPVRGRRTRETRTLYKTAPVLFQVRSERGSGRDSPLVGPPLSQSRPSESESSGTPAQVVFDGRRV